MFRFSLLVLFTIAASCARAQEARFVLWDSVSNDLLPGVEIIQDGDTAYTNAQGVGFLSLQGRSLPRTYQFVMPGYKPGTYTLEGVPTGPITISLAPAFSLDEAVVTGLVMPEERNRTLGNYRIITADAAQRQGAVTLADALSTQPNINLGNDGILGSSASVLGLSADKVKILVDGMPVNGRENGAIDLGQLQLQNLKRIEIVQGPMSILYGSDALGGVINLITNRPQNAWSAGATLHYESIGRYNAGFQASRRLGQHHQVSLSGGRNFFQGWRYLDSEPHRQQLFKPKEQYYGSLAYDYAGNKDFRIHFAHDALQELVTNLGPVYVTPYAGYAFDERYHTTRHMTRLALEGRTGNGAWMLNNSLAYYHRIRERLVKDMVMLTEQPTTATGDQDTSTFIDLNLRGVYAGRAYGRLQYSLGYDVLMQRGESRKIPGGNRYQNDYAAFGTLAYRATGINATAQAGLRAAYNTHFQAPVLPSLSVLWEATRNWQFRAAYAQAFRAPSLKEQYLQFVDQNHDITGNENLLPERSHQVQGSITRTDQFSKGNYLRGTLTGYFNALRDQITLVNLHPEDSLNTAYSYGNLSKMSNLIGVILLEGKAGDFTGSVSFSEMHQRPAADAGQPFVVHELTANAAYLWSRPALTFSLFGKWTGAQPLVVQDISGNFVFAGRLPAYLMADASVSRRFWKNRIRVVAGVKNLLDVQVLNAGAGGGGVAGSAHGTGSGSTSFLGRRIFTTLALDL